MKAIQIYDNKNYFERNGMFFLNCPKCGTGTHYKKQNDTCYECANCKSLFMVGLVEVEVER